MNIEQQALYIDRSDELTSNLTTMSEAFDSLHTDIVSRLGVDSSFDVRIILEVIKAAGTAKDGREYFNGPTFKYHCYLLGLDHEVLIKTIRDKKLVGTRKRGKQADIAKEKAREIIEKYLTGEHSYSSLQKEYSLSAKYISNILHDIKIDRYARSETFENDVISDRVNYGHSMKDIASKRHVDIQAIRNILQPLGLNKALPKRRRYHLDKI
jgi:hypothetical protein